MDKIDYYALSQEDFHVIEEKVLENPKLLTTKDSNERLFLHWAALAGREQLVEHILKNSRPEIDDVDDTNASSLILSVLGGHIGVAEMLIKKGANVNHKKAGGYSVLQYACSKGFKNIVELLIQHKADVNIKDDRQDTPLHRIAPMGRTQIAKLLIEAGADVNSQNKEGNTPLHLACEDEQTEFALFLISKGAKIDILNKEKQTIVDVCKPGLKRQVEAKFEEAENELDED